MTDNPWEFDLTEEEIQEEFGMIATGYDGDPDEFEVDTDAEWYRLYRAVDMLITVREAQSKFKTDQ